MARHGVDINDCAKEVIVTINLTGLREFRIRLFLAKSLFLAGAWIAGFSAKIEGGK